MSTIRVSHPTKKVEGNIPLNGSKSISNRVLIIRALCDQPFTISHLSTSDDTQTLKMLLKSFQEVYDCHHAGTTFRFLTSFLAIQDGTQILTGSERMKERPIGPLVDALISIGANIEYLDKKGYPPLQIHSFNFKNYRSSISVKADISSQYITALLLIAPILPMGLEINLVGELVSEPYLNMTLSTLNEFGIHYNRSGGKIFINHQKYIPKDYVVEADWSAASYFYSIATLAEEAKLSLEGLFSHSIQGDSKMKDIGELFGIESQFVDGKLWLTKKSSPQHSIFYDFINQPDLAQTIAVMCSAVGMKASFTGLQTLKIKETDRIAAIQNELGKIAGDFKLDRVENDKEYYKINNKCNFSKIPRFKTYKDHRMAMAFASLALLHDIEFEKPEVVTKSYPNFWKDLESIGFVVSHV
jgi:3-phosphoshikimate 1-carboxyvinyltransferase